MATKATTRILAHGIGGGWDLRHEGCAPKCCEAKAEPVTPAEWNARPKPTPDCGGCGASLCDPPAPMDFDRDATCESCADAIAFADHRAADPHCTCNDCSDLHFATPAKCSCDSTIDVVDGAPICPVHDPQSDDE